MGIYTEDGLRGVERLLNQPGEEIGYTVGEGLEGPVEPPEGYIPSGTLY